MQDMMVQLNISLPAKPEQAEMSEPESLDEEQREEEYPTDDEEVNIDLAED